MRCFTSVFRRTFWRGLAFPLQRTKTIPRCLYVPMILFLASFVYFQAVLFKYSAVNVRGDAGLNGLSIRHLFKNPVNAVLSQRLENNGTASPNYNSSEKTSNITEINIGNKSKLLIQENHDIEHLRKVKTKVKVLSNLTANNSNKSIDIGKLMLERQNRPPHHQRKILKASSSVVISPIINWKRQTQTFCNGNFQSFSKKFIYLKNVLVTKALAHANATGGEDILSVKYRTEDDETYSYDKGFFTLNCSGKDPVKPNVSVDSNKYIASWFSSLRVVAEPPKADIVMNSTFTIAIARYEYANVFWALIDIYDSFLTLHSFGKKRSETHLLLVDAKPWSHMDNMWNTFFGSVSRLSQLPERVYYKDIVWNFERKNSPVLFRRPGIALQNEFRREMLRAYGLTERAEANATAYNNCSALARPFKVLFVWRRNYVAHPRNPTGIVQRKISNENELLNATKYGVKNCDVQGVQLDQLSVRDQLELISGTDVMIGMHGAAFAFTWFLPPGSGAIELFPATHAGNWHMANIAENNQVVYNTWKNRDPKNERLHAKSTRIPPEIVVTLIDDMIKTICHQKEKPIKLVMKMPGKNRTISKNAKNGTSGRKVKRLVKKPR